MSPAITAENRKWWVVVAMSGIMILLTLDFFGLTGLALSVALFRGMENHSVISEADRANGPAPVTAHLRRVIRDVLSGPQAARSEVHAMQISDRTVVNSIVDDSFSKGLQAVMLLGAGLSFFSVWPALWGRRRVPSRVHRRAHGFSPAHWRPHPQPVT